MMGLKLTANLAGYMLGEPRYNQWLFVWNMDKREITNFNDGASLSRTQATAGRA